MIQCGVCGFGVNELMKFALVQNKCPSCGNGLFSDNDMNLMSTIQSKLAGQRFASKLTTELIYDLSLFIFNEMKGDLGKMLPDQHSGSKPDEPELTYHEEIDDVRREIEAEYQDHLETLSDDGEVMDEDLQVKAEKLRRMHHQQLIHNPNIGKIPVSREPKKSGPKVTRVT